MCSSSFCFVFVLQDPEFLLLLLFPFTIQLPKGNLPVLFAFLHSLKLSCNKCCDIEMLYIFAPRIEFISLLVILDQF